jgi:hypothetical protein
MYFNMLPAYIQHLVEHWRIHGHGRAGLRPIAIIGDERWRMGPGDLH